MMKFLRIVLILGAFLAGLYVGRQPPEEIKNQIRELSQGVVEQTVGLVEEDLLVQKKVVQATSGFLNGRAKMLAGKQEEAIADLEKTLEHLEQAVRMKGSETSDALREAMAKVADLQRAMADGQAVSQEKLEAAQEQLNSLLWQT